MSNRYFSTEKVNAGRQPELDLLKAICIVGMIVVHVFLDLGKNVMPTACNDYVTEFFGAATFMTCMGIGMRYAHNQSPSAYLARAFGLLTIGQFLNILRNAVPNLIAWWITGKQFFIANAFTVIQADILTFAGLAFLVMALCKMLKLSDGAILGIGVLMSFISLILWNTVPSPENYLLSQIVGFFILTNAEAYFPLFCYFIFVAFGYFIGGYYPRIKDKDGLSNRVMAICFPTAAVYYVIRFTVDMPFMPELGTDAQYNMKPLPDALATCIFTLGIIALLYKVVKAMGGSLPAPVMHFSKYINNYYCLSYIFILPLQTILIAVTGHLLPGTVIPILYSIFVIVACYVLIELNETRWHIHFITMKGWKLTVFVASVWILTIAIVAYTYPRIEVFANVWNDYLLP